MATITKQARKKVWAFLALGTFVGLLLLPLFLSLPAGAGDTPAPAASTASASAAPADAKPVEKSRDVWFKTEGPVIGAPAPKTTDSPKDYPRYNFESRVILWVALQQHLYYGSFVLAVPIFCMIVEYLGVITKDKALSRKYDQLAYDFVKISLTAYSLTALLGGIVIFTFLTLYPTFFGYLSSIFRPVIATYALLFIAESGTLYIYYYGWDKMREGFLKWIHVSMSVILNVIGTVLMMLANSWIAFMQSPAGVDADGRYLGNVWHVIHTTLWNPINVHRLLGNMAFGGGVVAAYAAYRFLTAKSDEERAHYDWMGYVAMFIGICFLIPLPFAGYWLMREVYAYRQQMGITLMGGLLAWLFIIHQRANKIPTVKWAPYGNAFLFGLFTMAYVNIIWLAIYGYYIPANVRVGLSVPQVASTLSCLFIGVILNSIMLKGAKDVGPIVWGQISVRGQYALIMLATSFTWMMGLMGYIRSSVRLFWHVNEIMRDNSPWAFTHTIGFGANMISFNVLFFWLTILFVFWLGALASKKAPVTAPVGQKVPVPAGSH